MDRPPAAGGAALRDPMREEGLSSIPWGQECSRGDETIDPSDRHHEPTTAEFRMHPFRSAMEADRHQAPARAERLDLSGMQRHPGSKRLENGLLHAPRLGLCGRIVCEPDLLIRGEPRTKPG